MHNLRTPNHHFATPITNSPNLLAAMKEKECGETKAILQSEQSNLSLYLPPYVFPNTTRRLSVRPMAPSSKYEPCRRDFPSQASWGRLLHNSSLCTSDPQRQECSEVVYSAGEPLSPDPRCVYRPLRWIAMSNHERTSTRKGTNISRHREQTGRLCHRNDKGLQCQRGP